MSSFEKSVKGATKVKLAPPKSKYIEHILQATRAGEPGVAEVFRSLQFRLRDTTWTIAFKSLIVVHLMIREGEANAALTYLSLNPRQQLGGPLHTYADVQSQGRNIRHYTQYLIERARSFQKGQVDYVRSGTGRMKQLSVDKGLLRETESLQEQIHALTKCDLLTDEPENEITLTAFRLLAMDLLALFPVLNEASINVLENFFEMSKPDAERALQIYKRFTKQTEVVVRFLQVAKTHEQATRLEIPKIRHAPLSLATSLEEYLNDPDFDVNRKQYLAEREAKKTGRPMPTSSKSSAQPAGFQGMSSQTPTTTPGLTTAATSQAASSPVSNAMPNRRPADDLIDFFSSIEQYSQPTGQVQTFPQYQAQQQPQTVSFNDFPQQNTQFSPPQNNNPYDQVQQQQPQLQTQQTGAGFGGFGPQPYATLPMQFPQTMSFPGNNFSEQQQLQQFSSPQSTQQLQSQPTSNPFRQSSMPTGTAQFSNQFSAMQQQPSTNPYNPVSSPPSAMQQQQQQPFYSQSQVQPQSQLAFTQLPPMAAQPTGSNPFGRAATFPLSNTAPVLSPQKTGTNPFARSPPLSQSQSPAQANAASSPPPLVANPTGSTNPFRQSAFVNQATGMGWQHGQGTMGGFEQLGTVPVFPRPGGGTNEPPNGFQQGMQSQPTGQQAWYQ